MDKIKNYFFSIIASELSEFSAFYDRTYFFSQEYTSDSILDKLKSQKKQLFSSISELSKSQDGDLFIFDGTLNYSDDIQALLEEINLHTQRHTRVAIILYNSYLRYIYKIASFLKIRTSKQPTLFLTKLNLQNLCELSNFEIVRIRSAIYIPFYIPILSNFINMILPVIPWLSNFSFTQIAVLRSINASKTPPSLSIIIPARNERDNIKNSISRIPKLMTDDLEIIYVEGNSTDTTWEEITELKNNYSGPYSIKVFKQDGIGKKDAVDKGYQHCTKDLVTILDADLTMPPENLVQFYDAYRKGYADFVNGNRLFYPMEDKAMRPLNLMGNVIFSKLLSYVLANQLSDTLCGTKLFSSKHLKMIVNWNKNFGNFDPFGDFEMIFPASVLGFGTINLPIKYRNRTYGETNIQRFRHGALLFKMVLVGLFKIKVGRTK